MKRSRLWLLFPILSVFMIIFAFWLSRQEGSYKQAMELSFEPVQDMFTIELQAEEKYMEPHVSDGDTELMWESATGNGKSYLRKESSRSIGLESRLRCVSRATQGIKSGKWKYCPSAGYPRPVARLMW